MSATIEGAAMLVMVASIKSRPSAIRTMSSVSHIAFPATAAVRGGGAGLVGPAGQARALP